MEEIRSDKFVKRACAIIRSYNNPAISDAVKRCLDIGFGQIIVVVNAKADRGATKGFLECYRSIEHIRILEIEDGYTWSNALNRALLSVSIQNAQLQSRGKPTFRQVFNVSTEAIFGAEHLQAMLDELYIEDDVAVVGTSFAGIQNGESIQLGASYRHPRNTGMLISLDKLPSAYFDTRCDDIGGMEDIDFILRMRSLQNLQCKMLDLKVPLLVGVNYDQRTKEAREQEAVDKIVSYWSSLFDLGTAENTRIQDVISEMRL